MQQHALRIAELHPLFLCSIAMTANQATDLPSVSQSRWLGLECALDLLEHSTLVYRLHLGFRLVTLALPPTLSEACVGNVVWPFLHVARPQATCNHYTAVHM